VQEKEKNFIAKSIELDKKKPKSDKIFSALGISAGVFALSLLLINIIFYIFAVDLAVDVWFFLYYPMVIVIIVGIFCSWGQLLRNHYISTIVALILNNAAAVAIIAISIFQGVRYGQVFAMPFYWRG